MKYDKSGTGWATGTFIGRAMPSGGTARIFILFLSGWLARPAFPQNLKLDSPCRQAGQRRDRRLPLWAEFYLKDYGWVPIDASEAWKDPSKREYFFGAHDANRVQFSVGRDLILASPQAGPPLNFFVYPTWKWTGNRFRR